MSKLWQVEIEVPATVSNLGPGFDCMGMSVGMANKIRARAAPAWSFSCLGPWGAGISKGPDNLLRRSYERSLADFGGVGPCLEVEMEIEVPPGRGFGSSATAVAAGLALGKILGGFEVSARQLARLGAEIEGHPDNVVPALFGGFCLCVGADGQFLRFDPPANLVLIALFPEQEVSTAEARRALPGEIALPAAVFNLSRSAALAASFITGKLQWLRDLDLVRDRLHQEVRSKGIPHFHRAVDVGLKAGALGVCISGSGPAVLALCSEESDLREISRAMATVLAPVECRVLRPRGRGVLDWREFVG